MKKIVRGNDFTLRIPVKKIVNGEQVSFPLTDCTDIAVHVVSKYKRTALPYTIDKESNDVLLADVDGTTLSLGTYALEVTGVLEGANWRSYEYEQFPSLTTTQAAIPCLRQHSPMVTPTSRAATEIMPTRAAWM